MNCSNHCLIRVALLLIFTCCQVERSNAFSAPTAAILNRPKAPQTIFHTYFDSTLAPSRMIPLFSEPPNRDGRTNDIIGIRRGFYLMGVVLLLNVWIFSIPPEFRRAKICTEEQVIMFPKSGCMTGKMWADGVSAYYSNGGGISFDFTIDKTQQPAWAGGDLPTQKILTE